MCGSVVLFWLCASAVLVRDGLCAPPPPKEAWNYVEVRDGAHMFWWLYHAEAGFRELPLVMWLQGGPGGSGSGFGNFQEIGPLDRDLQPRSTSEGGQRALCGQPRGHRLQLRGPGRRLRHRRVHGGLGHAGAAPELLHGAARVPGSTAAFHTSKPPKRGSWVLAAVFSVSDLSRSQDDQRLFWSPQSIPFYIFSESYGGKMAAAVSLELTKAVAQGSVKCSFAGVALGDSWISPLDSVMTWGPYLYTTSLLDDSGLADVSGAAEAVKQAVEQQSFLKATELWSVAETVVEQNTNGVNFYNILTQESEDKRRFSAAKDFISLQALRHVSPLQRPSLSQLMNGPIRKKLGIIPQNVTWGGQAEDVFSNMAGDFMKPVVDVVDQLLSAGVNVTVYNGQLDLIVDTLGQEQWVKRLKWDGLPGFSKLRWTPLDDPASQGATGAFYKTYKNFSFYWILKAGHMIPSDQGAMALKMLKMVTQQD